MRSNTRTGKRAAPSAPKLTLWGGAAVSKTGVFSGAGAGESWHASLSGGDGWLTLGAVAGTGPEVIDLSFGANEGPARKAALAIAFPGSRKRPSIVYDVRQASAEALLANNRMALADPFPGVPRVMELGIAAKYVASLIKKIPKPFSLIALAIVEVVIIALGVVVYVVRLALAPVLPEPKTWLPANTPFIVLKDAVPASGIVIIQETVNTAAYTAKQALA